MMRKRIIGLCPLKVDYDHIAGYYELAILQVILVDDEGIYTPSLFGFFLDSDNYTKGKYIFYKLFERPTT